MLPGDAYLPNQESSDDYRCFLVDWTGDAVEFVMDVQDFETVSHNGPTLCPEVDVSRRVLSFLVDLSDDGSVLTVTVPLRNAN